MGDENLICTLGDYSKPSHEGYRNTIELPEGNNVVPLRSDTIRLVQNGCSFHGFWFEDPNQHLKDFLKLVDSLDLDQDPSPHGRILLLVSLHNSFHREGLQNSEMTSLCCNNIKESLSLKHGLVLRTYSKKSLIMASIFGSKSKSSMTMSIPSLDEPSINRPVPVKAISLTQDVPSKSDYRLIKLKNQVQRLMEARLAPKQHVQVNKITSSCEICSSPHNTQYRMENIEQVFIEYASSYTNEAGGKCRKRIPSNRHAVIDCRKAKVTVGEGITRSVLGVKGIKLGEEEAPYWTTLGKKESYRPRPSLDGMGAQTPYYARKESIDCYLPGEWEIARDAEINPFKDIMIRLIDPDGEEYTKTLQSIPTSRKLYERESPREIINLDHFYDMAFVRLRDPKLKTLGERGIECIFVGYADHSKAFRFYVIKLNESVSINSIIESMDDIFDENRFLSVPRPCQRSLINGTEDIGGSVVHVEVTKEVLTQQPKLDLRKRKRNRTPKNFGPEFQLNLIEGISDEMDVKTIFLNGELDEEVYMNQPQGFIMLGNENKVCKLIKSLYGLNKFDESGKGVIIFLYVDDMLIFGIDKFRVDMTNEFLSSELSMKDMGEADVILVSTLIDTSEKLMPNKGLAVSQLEYSRMIYCLMYAMTCTRSDIAFVLVIEGYTDASWIRNIEDNLSTIGWVFLLGGGIQLWSKPIVPVSICRDSAATLAKVYRKIYNGKSRHLGVRHSMIRELIMNGVVSVGN
ncbi:zinc finger, CCHC-type containing protein [Tanacetum coccineum]|uniref:Zinc finger, CCHC-type containing protein n=1 Tax=Tanacetum coccineum TaxID=301880 RepID=A0ABQ5C2Q9_9ASTR